MSNKTNEKAVILSSGGVDSTTCVGIAVERFGKENVCTVSVFYNQKHSKELECAQKVANHYGVDHTVIDLSGTHIFDYSECPLLKGSNKDIRHESYADQIAKDGEGMVETYVPFRNGLMLSSVAAFAVSKYPDNIVHIYLGAHADDAAGSAYADCSKEFTDAMYEAISIGTYDKVKVEAPLVNMNKAEVVKTGLELNVPYSLTWSCYEGGDVQCGTCGTCIDRKNAFRANGVEDPVPYKE